MTARALPAESSAAALPSGSVLRRLPVQPKRPRPAEFSAKFDDKTLFYDCFWHMDGARVLLVGAPPVNLRAGFELARFVARPSGTAVKARFHRSLSTMVTELTGVPAGTTHVEMTMGTETVSLAVQPSSVAVLENARVLFSINRDNDLAWIREWALFHARHHGTDAVILVDNGSTRYEAAEVEATLRDVPGVAHVAVPQWAQSFGPIDTALKVNRYWTRFLQIGSMSMVLRRYGERAYGLLDCDIDELAGTRSGASIYDLAKQSRGGLIAFRGTWIEAAAGNRHRDYTMRLADPEAATCRQRKWALDPSRAWVRRLSVHPYWHWIEGRPWFSKSMPSDALYWHFKGINTNWKQQRTQAPDAAVEVDELLRQRFGDLP